MNASVAVFGTVFVDCKGFAHQRYQPDSRNLGAIRFVQGGVARNVAENLARLDVPVTFVSMADATGIGNEVVDRLKKTGVDTSRIRILESGGMGMWLAILDETGNLAGSISQMPDLRQLDAWVAACGEEAVRNVSHVVLELDLTERIAAHVVGLAERHGKPVFGIPGNLDVVMKHPELLARLDCFICNHHEAGQLFRTDLTETMDPQVILGLIRRYVEGGGPKSMVVTMGERGSVCFDSRTGEGGHQPVFPVRMVDSSGAGDAFFSGTTMGRVRGLPLRDAVVCGTKVAGWTIESPENNCLELRGKVATDAFFQALKVRG